MWDAAKAGRESYSPECLYQTGDSSQVNILSSCLKKLEREEKNKTKARRRK